MDIPGLSFHSGGALPPRQAAFKGLLRLKTSPWTKLLPVTQSQLQGGPELRQGARPQEEGVGQSPGRSRQDVMRLAAQAPCCSPSLVFSFLPLFLESWLRAGSDDAITASKPEQANKRDLSGVGGGAKFLRPVRLGQSWPLCRSLTGHSWQRCHPACLPAGLPVLSGSKLLGWGNAEATPTLVSPSN